MGHRKYSGLTISFVELKVKMKSEMLIDQSAESKAMEIVVHFLYSDPMAHRVGSGKLDAQTAYWGWPLVQLDGLRIEPFVFVHDTSFGDDSTETTGIGPRGDFIVQRVP